MVQGNVFYAGHGTGIKANLDLRRKETKADISVFHVTSHTSLVYVYVKYVINTKTCERESKRSQQAESQERILEKVEFKA